jgi:hypothetical protein
MAPSVHPVPTPVGFVPGSVQGAAITGAALQLPAVQLTLSAPDTST